ncbi:hypothetical protein O181_120176, partial [Austropuccinia psidii MF-1]|nr:hypothetical protein [Austropuccinia psidii MF-1]
SSIRESSSDSEASESSIEIQTSPAPRGLITKEPFKGPSGHSSHKSIRQDCQARAEAQMEDSRTSPSSKRHHELISSSEEIHGARKDRGTSEGLDTHVLKRKSPTDKSFVEKPKHVIRRPEEEVGPRQGKQPSGSSPSLQKQKSASTSAQKAQESPKYQPEEQAEGKGKGKAQM